VPPTPAPSELPSIAPSEMPTTSPSPMPSHVPTSSQPTIVPTSTPTALPTSGPSQKPSVPPTPAPSELPSIAPSEMPTTSPSPMPSSVPTSVPSPCVQTFDVTYSICSTPCGIDWRGKVHTLGEYSYLDYSATCQLFSQNEEFFYVNSDLSFSGGEAYWTAFENVAVGPATYRTDICDSAYSGVIELHLTNSPEIQSFEFQGDMLNINNLKSDLIAKFLVNNYTEYDVDVELNIPRVDNESLHFDIALDLDEMDGDEMWAIECNSSLEVKVNDAEDIVVDNMALSGVVMDISDLFDSEVDGTHFKVEVTVDKFSLDFFTDDSEWYTEPFCVTADTNFGYTVVDFEEAKCSFRRKLMPYFQGNSKYLAKTQRGGQGRSRKLSTDASFPNLLIFADETGTTKNKSPQNDFVFAVLLTCSLILLVFAMNYLRKNSRVNRRTIT